MAVDDSDCVNFSKVITQERVSKMYIVIINGSDTIRIPNHIETYQLHNGEGGGQRVNSMEQPYGFRFSICISLETYYTQELTSCL